MVPLTREPLLVLNLLEDWREPLENLLAVELLPLWWEVPEPAAPDCGEKVAPEEVRVPWNVLECWNEEPEENPEPELAPDDPEPEATWRAA